MTTKNKSQVQKMGEWRLRVQIPKGDRQYPVILLLHGWTGDEDAMWIFTSRLPQDHLFIAPRGLYPTPHGGYSWHEYKEIGWPSVDDFRPAIDSLMNLLSDNNFPEAQFSKLSIVGFSQGAALGYTFALLHPDRLTAVAGLSGFLPNGVLPLIRERPLINKHVFITHGNQDELVPVIRAHRSVDLLQEAGADVTYCEDDVGHKLSADCFQGMENFFASIQKMLDN